MIILEDLDMVKEKEMNLKYALLKVRFYVNYALFGVQQSIRFGFLKFSTFFCLGF